MTHDELLKLTENIPALYEKVKQHRPYLPNFIEIDYDGISGFCHGCLNSKGEMPPVWVNCPTIQAIKEELG